MFKKVFHSTALLIAVSLGVISCSSSDDGEENNIPASEISSVNVSGYMYEYTETADDESTVCRLSLYSATEGAYSAGDEKFCYCTISGGADSINYGENLTLSLYSHAYGEEADTSSVTKTLLLSVSNNGDVTVDGYETKVLGQACSSYLSGYVNAMGGIDFGTQVFKGAAINTAEDGTKYATVYLGIGTGYIYTVAHTDIVDPVASIPGYYTDDWEVVRLSEDEYTLSENTFKEVSGNPCAGFYDSEGTQHESYDTQWISSITFPVSGEKGFYYLWFYINSNVMGVQFCDGTGSASSAHPDQKTGYVGKFVVSDWMTDSEKNDLYDYHTDLPFYEIVVGNTFSGTKTVSSVEHTYTCEVTSDSELVFTDYNSSTEETSVTYYTYSISAITALNNYTLKAYAHEKDEEAASDAAATSIPFAVKSESQISFKSIVLTKVTEEK